MNHGLIVSWHRDQLRRNGGCGGRRPARAAIRANLIRSQLGEHAPYGGVVPEIAARAHLDHIDELVRRALAEAGIAIGDVDAVAAACRPGADRRLIVGSMAAKGLAWAAGKPFIAVNHLEAHALGGAARPRRRFPYLLLLVSGGHTQLLACAGVGDYRSSAPAATTPPARPSTNRQAAGLGYPGGPAIERARRRRPAPLRAAAAAEGARGLRLLVFRAEDGGAADRR
jgi:N6-L-threonylcarbamoyladenine synthase